MSKVIFFEGKDVETIIKDSFPTHVDNVSFHLFHAFCRVSINLMDAEFSVFNYFHSLTFKV